MALENFLQSVFCLCLWVSDVALNNSKALKRMVLEASPTAVPEAKRQKEVLITTLKKRSNWKKQRMLFAKILER